MQRLLRLAAISLIISLILVCSPQVPILGPLLLVSEAIRSLPVIVFATWIFGFVISVLLLRQSAVRALSLLLVVGICASFYLVRMWPFLNTQNKGSETHNQTKVISIAIANVEFGRASPARLRESLSQVLPDVLVISEATASWLTEAKLDVDYEYKVEAPGRSAEGMAVFSRFPVEEAQRITPKFFHTLAMNVKVSESATMHLIAIHAPPPHCDPVFQFRTEYFKAIHEHISSLPAGMPLVLAGDFNTTPFSDAYQDFVLQNNLRNIAYGRGLPATWPLPMFPVTGAYIDQVLYREPIDGLNLEVLKNFGSDHLPLLTFLQF